MPSYWRSPLCYWHRCHRTPYQAHRARALRKVRSSFSYLFSCLLQRLDLIYAKTVLGQVFGSSSFVFGTVDNIVRLAGQVNSPKQSFTKKAPRCYEAPFVNEPYDVNYFLTFAFMFVGFIFEFV